MEFFKYHGVWAPGVRLFRKLQFGAKAAIISSMFLAPVLLLGWNYYVDKAVAIDFSAKERLGVAYARSLLSPLHAVLKPGAAVPDLRAALAEAQQRHGEALGTDATHAAALKAAGEGKAGATGEALLALLGQVSDGSNLTLDPDIDSYYVMDAVMFRHAPLLEQLGRLQAAAQAARGEGPAAQQAQREFSAAAAVFGYHLDNLRGGLAKAQVANPSLGEALKAGAALNSAAAVVAAAQQVLQQPGAAAAAGWTAFDGAAATYEREQAALGQRMLDVLDGLLATRVAGMTGQRAVVSVAVVVSLLLAVYLFYAFFLVTRGGLLEVRDHLVAMTAGDLTTRPRPWGSDEAASLMLNLSQMQASLLGIVSQVRAASSNLVNSSTEIAGGAMNLHGRTEQAAASLQQSAAAMEEVASVVRNTAGGAREAASLSASNAELAVRGGEIIASMVETMGAIQSSSTQIGEIIATIDSIAFQTNILALNAAVESARAGETGRGFAVVASEVRALALSTASAASEIKTLIGTSREQVQQGQQIVEQAGSAIGDIVGSARRINGLLAEISVGANEQAQGVTQTTQSVHELDALTQANSALVEQTAAAAATLKGQASELAQRVAAFRLPAVAAA